MSGLIHRRGRIFGVAENSTEPNKLLRIRILSASDLMRKDIFGLSDPYVKIILQHPNRNGTVVDFAKTRIIPKTLNPQWNEEFVFRVNPEKHRLLLEVFDNNKLIKDDFLGLVPIKLNSDIPTEVDDVQNYPKEFRLQKRAVFNRIKGSICVSLSYINPSSTTTASDANNRDTNNECSNFVIINQSDVSDSEPLPPGWEMRTDQSGRIYYVDHNTRTTSWHRPTVSATNDGSTQVVTQQPVSEAPLSNGNSSRDQRSAAAVPRALSLTERGPLQPSHNVSRNMSTVQPSTSTRANDIALPPGWQISYTARGRMFFINHNDRTTTWVDPRTGQPSPTSAASNAEDSSNRHLGPLPPGWEMRVHTDGRVFFIDHNKRKTQWEDPRLEQFAGPAVPYSRDFGEKVQFFRKTLPRPKSYVGGQIELHVSRENILESSFRAVMPFRDPEYLKARLWVIFDGEKGLDYGGVAREWFHLLAKELFNPCYGLFIYSAMDNYTLQINPLSGFGNDEHLRYFMFVGRIVGMAIYHCKLLDAFFVPPFYKMMLEKPVTLNDLESVDREYYNSLTYILENDPEDLDMYFSVSEEVFGETKEIELVQGGKDIKVTNENKRDFINKVMEWRFSGRIKSQMDHFMFGFNEIIPKDDIKLFDAKELELLISGIGEINVNDWKMHTLYKGEYSINHPVIQWFWKCLLSMNMEMRIRLLQFATGTSRLPMNGFAELWGSNGPQWFTIEKWGDRTKLPRAHTCFNRIDLPPYESYEELREKLFIAVEMSEGFEGVD